MTIERRVVVATASVCAIGTPVLAAVVLGPGGVTRVGLAAVGLVAFGMAISSLIAEPRELLAALVLGAMPVMALATEEATSWLVGPLAVLLLVGGELNAWSWELGESESVRLDTRRRTIGIVRLAALGLASSLLVTFVARSTSSTSLGRLPGVALAAAALAGLAWLIFPAGRSAGPPSDRVRDLDAARLRGRTGGR